MNIIPAIDILDGKCVRLSKGDYQSKVVYNENPLEVALEMEASGIKHIHVVDLDGARSKKIVNHQILRQLATGTGLKIDFGGGIKSEADLQIAFDAGAAQLTLGSIAVDEPHLVTAWLHKYGAEKLILGADCRARMVATQGWLKGSDLDVVTFIDRYAAKGIKNVICTDIDMDGMLQGPSIELYHEILAVVKVDLIASGGIASIRDLQSLKSIGCKGAIVGKAIYEGKISLKQIAALC